MSNNFAPNSTTPMLPAHLTSQAGNENLVLPHASNTAKTDYASQNTTCTSTVSLQKALQMHWAEHAYYGWSRQVFTSATTFVSAPAPSFIWGD